VLPGVGGIQPLRELGQGDSPDGQLALQGLGDCPNHAALEQQNREKSLQKHLSMYFYMRETALQLEIQVLALIAYSGRFYLF